MRRTRYLTPLPLFGLDREKSISFNNLGSMLLDSLPRLSLLGFKSHALLELLLLHHGLLDPLILLHTLLQYLDTHKYVEYRRGNILVAEVESAPTLPWQARHLPPLPSTPGAVAHFVLVFVEVVTLQVSDALVFDSLRVLLVVSLLDCLHEATVARTRKLVDTPRSPLLAASHTISSDCSLFHQSSASHDTSPRVADILKYQRREAEAAGCAEPRAEPFSRILIDGFVCISLTRIHSLHYSEVK